EGALKSMNFDDRISKRLLLSNFASKITVLFKQDADGRRVFSISDIWKSIDCLPMEKVTTNVCGDVPGCKFLMKSVYKIPNSYQSSFGNIVKVMTLDTNKEYSQTTLD